MNQTKNNSVLIRVARKEDVPEIHSLIVELAIYEKAPNEVKVSIEELLEDGFGNNPAYSCIVAEKDNEVVGFALYYIRYSTWKGRCVYLEDFLVKESYRKQGIGNLLFEEMLSISKKMKVRLITWQVLDWNKPAINFYNKYNSTYDSEWLNGKINFNLEED